MTRPPAFVADYYGACAGCGEDIVPDDTVCADGHGGYVCEECAFDDGLLCDCGGDGNDG